MKESEKISYPFALIGVAIAFAIAWLVAYLSRWG